MIFQQFFHTLQIILNNLKLIILVILKEALKLLIIFKIILIFLFHKDVRSFKSAK